MRGSKEEEGKKEEGSSQLLIRIHITWVGVSHLMMTSYVVEWTVLFH